MVSVYHRGMEASDSDPRVYMRLAASLRSQITGGQLRSGQPVTSITVLCQEHGTARQTVAKAMGVLEREGLIFRVPSLGYYVR
jgi:DNA-binding GntR family transcriptional regulator